MIEKSQLRNEFLKKRRDLSKEEVDKLSNQITALFTERYGNTAFNNIMLYSSFDNEPDTADLAKYFNNKNCAVAYPYIKAGEIIPKIPSQMIKRSFGILEPTSDSQEIDPKLLDLIIVPGIGFDRNKNRIGFGKGYYDRFLKQTSALKIALAYSFQISDKYINSDAFDIPMDAIVTESVIIE